MREEPILLITPTNTSCFTEVLADMLTGTYTFGQLTRVARGAEYSIIGYADTVGQLFSASKKDKLWCDRAIFYYSGTLGSEVKLGEWHNIKIRAVKVLGVDRYERKKMASGR